MALFAMARLPGNRHLKTLLHMKIWRSLGLFILFLILIFIVFQYTQKKKYWKPLTRATDKYCQWLN